MEQEQVNKLEDWMIDSRIQDVKERNEEIDRLKEIAQKRVDDINLRLQNEVEKLEKQNHYDLETIKQAVLMHDKKKETTTQYKVKFVSGNAVVKKRKSSVKKPNKKVFEDIFKNYPEFRKIKQEEDLNWKDLKARLELNNGKVIDTETGEDVSDMFEIDEKDEEIVID